MLDEGRYVVLLAARQTTRSKASVRISNFSFKPNEAAITMSSEQQSPPAAPSTGDIELGTAGPTNADGGASATRLPP